MRCNARLIRLEMTRSPECRLAMSFISLIRVTGITFDLDVAYYGARAGHDLEGEIDLVLLFIPLLGLA